MVKQNDLIRYKEETAESVVLVGNGAINNGWYPLREVLDPLISNGNNVSEVVRNIKIQNCETFHQLAIFSYRFKLYRANLLRKIVEGELTLEKLQKNGFDPIVGSFLKLRNDIASSYSKERNELSLKLTDKIKDLIGDKALYITTNWDETLWHETNVKSVAYLHGRAGLPQSIVFPTDLLIDDSMCDPSRLAGFETRPQEFKILLSDIFRFESLRHLMDTINFSCNAIKAARRIIVWGFNLSDYDADINTLLSTNTHPDQELVVINPDFSAFARAVGLTNITNAIHFNPDTELCLKLN